MLAPSKDSSRRMTTAEAKQCADCKQQLPLSEFYKIKSSDESAARWEKVCKTCKKERRRKKVQKTDDPVLCRHPVEPTKQEPRYREDGELIFKEYRYPNGELLQITKEEFDRVVDLFRLLDEQDRKINRPPPLEEKEMFELPNGERDSNHRE